MKYRPVLVTAMAVLGLLLSAPLASAASGGSDAPAVESTSDMERVSAYVQPSVVYLDVQWTGYVRDTFNRAYLNNGHPFVIDTQCTGYVVNPDGYIATAGHCVDPRGDIFAIMVQQAAQWAVDHHYYADSSLTVDDVIGFGDYRIEGMDTQGHGPDRKVTAAWGVSAGGVDSGESYQARVLKFQPFDKGDGAILKIEATDLPAIELADSDDLEVGTDIVSIGYPASVDLVTDASFTPSFKDGTVSSTKTIQDGLLTVYEISAAVSGGMSGGPTVNLDGHVVGFNSFKIDSSVESQQFNFVRPTKIVTELMADVGVDNDLGDISEQYRAGLDAYFAGDKEAAVASLQAVVDDQPTNEFAQDFLGKAEDLPDPTDDGEFPLLPVAVGAGALLVVIAAVLLVVIRRGPSRAVAVAAGGGDRPVAGTDSATWPPPEIHITGGYGPVPPVVASTAPRSGSVPADAMPSSYRAATLVAPGPRNGSDSHLEDGEPFPRVASAAQGGTAFCTSCGAGAAENQRFCGSCGSPL